MLYAIIASLMLHASFLYVVGPQSPANPSMPAPPPKGQSESVKLNIIDKPQVPNKQKSEDKKPDLDQGKVLVKKEKKKKKKEPLPPEQVLVERECTDFYSGIGVTHRWGDYCEVLTVPKGYPADRAGLRPGDLVMREPGTNDCPGRGELGTTLTIKFLRGVELFTKTLIREKICLGDGPDGIK